MSTFGDLLFQSMHQQDLSKRHVEDEAALLFIVVTFQIF